MSKQLERLAQCFWVSMLLGCSKTFPLKAVPVLVLYSCLKSSFCTLKIYSKNMNLSIVSFSLCIEAQTYIFFFARYNSALHCRARPESVCFQSVWALARLYLPMELHYPVLKEHPIITVFQHFRIHLLVACVSSTLCITADAHSWDARFYAYFMCISHL